jgi:Homeodomain-like domain
VVTVEADADEVEERLRAGRLVCPGCSGVLRGWGHGRGRELRGPEGLLWVRPRRSRCAGCGVTQVLLPVVALLRRADAAVVIGAALAAKAGGSGYRRIAAALGRPEETVRGWLRRFAGRVEAVRVVFTGWLVALAPDPVMPEPAGSAWADAVTAITAAAGAVATRFGLGAVAPWEVVVSVSGGRLLAPGWPPVLINTSCP